MAVEAQYVGVRAEFNVFDPGLKRAIAFASGGGAVAISRELAQVLAVEHPGEFVLTTSVSLFDAEAVAAAATANSAAVSGRPWSRADVHASVTVAGSTGAFTVKVQASGDDSTYVDLPCYDVSSGAADMVTSKALTESDSIILRVETWCPYVRVVAVNTRDAECAITADLWLW